MTLIIRKDGLALNMSSAISMEDTDYGVNLLVRYGDRLAKVDGLNLDIIIKQTTGVDQGSVLFYEWEWLSISNPEGVVF